MNKIKSMSKQVKDELVDPGEFGGFGVAMLAVSLFSWFACILFAGVGEFDFKVPFLNSFTDVVLLLFALIAWTGLVVGLLALLIAAVAFVVSLFVFENDEDK